MSENNQVEVKETTTEAVPAPVQEKQKVQAGLASVKESCDKLVVALVQFINVSSLERDEVLAKAIKRAGGDKYKAESHGFDPRKYNFITKAEMFLKDLGYTFGG